MSRGKVALAAALSVVLFSLVACGGSPDTSNLLAEVAALRADVEALRADVEIVRAQAPAEADISAYHSGFLGRPTG